MASEIPVPSPTADALLADDAPELGTLFHRLNNQLGIILANAELLESKLQDECDRARARQIVAGVVAAIATANDLRTSLPQG